MSDLVPVVSVVHLVRRVPSEPTKSATPHQWLWVADMAYVNGQGFVGSADNAKKLVEGELPGSHIIVWEPDWWGGREAIANYLYPCAVEFRTFDLNAYYLCPNCGVKWVEGHRIEAEL